MATRLSSAAQSATNPRVAFDGRGNALAIWQDTRAGTSSVRSAARPAGGHWSRSVEIAPVSTMGGAESAHPALAVDAKGAPIAKSSCDTYQRRRSAISLNAATSRQSALR